MHQVRIVSGDQPVAPLGHVPLIPNAEIRHDDQAVSYCNGVSMVMEGCVSLQRSEFVLKLTLIAKF